MLKSRRFASDRHRHSALGIANLPCTNDDDARSGGGEREPAGIVRRDRGDESLARGELDADSAERMSIAGIEHAAGNRRLCRKRRNTTNGGQDEWHDQAMRHHESPIVG